MTSSCSDNNNNDDDWDALAFDPHQASYEQGKTEGRTAGGMAGFRDGQALGHTKGLDFGMEIGFIRGFLLELNNEEEEPSSDSMKKNRIERSKRELEKALEDFPPPNLMFEQVAEGMTRLGVVNVTQQQNSEDDTEDPSKLDILAKLQRIRARFKLLTVQLGIPQASLKQVLDSAATSSDESNNMTVPVVDNEW
jgi:hypothetical protein